MGVHQWRTHTVTTGENCTWNGYIHASVSIVEPVFEWVVPTDAPSVLPYFCAPHCINGMVGVIHVSQPCTADVTGDGTVGADDILLVLDQWGAVIRLRTLMVTASSMSTTCSWWSATGDRAPN